jgi:di/tricarboxylate transporter
MTQIGTPPNLLVSEALAAAGHRPFGMFDFAPTGAVVFGVGLVYLLTVGRRFLPDRSSPNVSDEVLQTREYLAELLVPAPAAIAGQSLMALRWGRRFDVSVAGIIRDGHRLRFPSAHESVFVGDVLLVEGERDAVLRLVEAEDLEFAPEGRAVQALVDDAMSVVLELVAGPSFGTRGRSLVDLRFRNQLGGLVLGVWRQGARVRTPLRRLRIRPGDALLVRMPRDRIADLEKSQELIMLSGRSRVVAPRPRMLLAVAILAMAIGLAATGVAHIAVAGMLGGVLMVLARVLPYDRLYAAVEWRTLILIATLLPLGHAMQSTGLAFLVADNVGDVLRPYGSLPVLAGIFLLTAVLTQLMSNAAAVVLIAPIALGMAASSGIAPHPVMMVAIAGSAAFLTPVGHQANLLVYNTGAYRFFEFLKLGGPLTLLILITSLIQVPWVWPL